MGDSTKGFKPSDLPLRSMRGGDYMDVKHRLVWLRETHPEAHILTEEKAHDPGKWATFRASVTVPGGGSATGHGSETAGDFGDYYEKAETKALGRALAALGFGAQFLPEDGEALADSPMDRSRGHGATNRPQTSNEPRETVNRETGEITRTSGPAASDKQINFILALGKQRGYTVLGDDGKEHANEEQVAAAVNRELRSNYVSIRQITKDDAKRLLDLWAPKDGEQQRPAQQAPTSIRQPEPDTVDASWTNLWGELRQSGIRSGDIAAATDLIGMWNTDNPAALLAQLRMKVASMPKPTGTAGQDRWSS